MKKNNFILLLLLNLFLINFCFADPKSFNYRWESNFFGGMIPPFLKYQASKDTLVNLENMYFDEFLYLQNRQGWLKYSSSDLNKEIESLHLYKDSNGIKYNLASTDTKLFSFGFLSKTEYDNPLPLQTTTNYRREFVNDNQQCFIGDGLNRNLKFNGRELQYAGVYPPTTDMSYTLVNSNSNIEVGTYQYFYTYYIDTALWNPIESDANLNILTVEYSDTTKAILLTGFDTTVIYDTTNSFYNPLINKVRIYRTRKNIGLFFRVGEIDITDTNYFLDTFNDTEMNQNKFSKVGRYPLPEFDIAVVYKDIVFVAGNPLYPDRLYYSKYNQPEYHEKDIDYFIMPENQTITGLAVTNSHLVIYTKTRTHLIYIPNYNAPQPWTFSTISKSMGCIAHKSIANAEKGIIYASNLGIVAFGVVFVGDFTSDGNFDFLGKETQEDFRLYINLYPERVRSAFYDHIYYLSYSTNGIYNDKVYVFNTLSKKGSYYTGVYWNDFLVDNDVRSIYTSTSLKDGNIYSILDGAATDGDIYFNYNDITNITQIYNSLYSDTVNVLQLENRVYSDTFYSDTDLIGIMKGQTAYIYTSDTISFLRLPIIDNDSHSITVLGDISGSTIGYKVKSGSKDCILHKSFDSIGDVRYEKELQSMRLEYFSPGDALELRTWLNNEDTYTVDLIVSPSSSITYDSGYIYDDGLQYDGFNSLFTKIIYFDILQFDRIMFEFRINTFENIGFRQYFLYGNYLREEH